MERQHNESNYPSGTWESVWVNLIIRATEEWRKCEIHNSWYTTKQLYAWLPLECKKDCKKLMDKIIADLGKITVKSAWYEMRKILLWKAEEKYLYPKLLELHTKIQESLEVHGWICKPVGANPQIKHKKEAWA